MKKKNIVATLAALACASSMGAALVACGGDEDTPRSYTIVFDTNGGSTVTDQGVTGGGKITEPGDPTRFGYEFDGWYKDENCTQVWTFETDKVTGDLTLYAKWKEKDATANTYFDFIKSGNEYRIKAKVGQTLPQDVKLPATYDGKPVTAIDDGAFEGQQAMRSVIVPASVKEIGARAFRNCANLEQISGADGVESIGGTAFGGTKFDSAVTSGAAYVGKVLYKFVGTDTELTVKAGTLGIAASALQDNTTLTKLTLPDGLKNIGNYAFGATGEKNGVKLTELNIPDSVVKIGGNAFRNAKTLAKLTVGKGVKEIGANAFYGTAVTDLTYNASATLEDNSFCEVTADAKITFGNAVTELPQEILGMYPNLTEVTFGTGITEIPADAFSGKTKLAKITAGASLTKIGANAFAGTALTEYTVGKEVTSIGANAFKDCVSLTKVTFNAENATAPAKSAAAFSGCTALKTIVIGAEAKTVPDYAFAGVAATSITLGDNVEKIGVEAFSGAAVTEITVGEKVKEIGDGAFAENSALTTVKFNAVSAANKSQTTIFPSATSITFGAKVTRVPEYMVSGNTAITTVTIPDNAELGAHAFDGCTALATINGIDKVRLLGADALKDTAWLTAFTAGEAQADGVVYLGNILYAFNGEMAENYTLEVKAGTTSIADGAFEGQTNLVAVNLPDSVTYIGARAFKGCTALTGTVNLKNVTDVGDEAFRGDANIEAVTMDGKLEAVGESAFRGCKKAVMTLVMPETARSLGASAFFDCYELRSIEIKGGITEIPANCFYMAYSSSDVRAKGVVTSIKLAASVERVGDYWAAMNKVTEFQAPGLKFLGKYAFAYMRLQVDTEQFLEIPDSAFMEYVGLKKLVVSENCTVFGACFWSSTSNTKNVRLESAEIKCNITEIAANTFSSQPDLMKVILPDSLTSIGDSAFLDCPQAMIYGGMTNKLTSIGIKAFCNVRGFGTPVDLSGVKTLGNSAFDNSHLSGEIVLNAELERVPEYCFQKTNISKVTVSNDYTSFWGTGCFTSCPNLRVVELKEGVTKMYASQFTSITAGQNATLILPSTIKEIPAAAANNFAVVKLGSYVAPTTLALSQTKNQSSFATGARFVCKDAATLAQYVGDTSVWKTAAGEDWSEVWQPRFSVESADGWVLSESGTLVIYYGDRANIVIPAGLTEMPELSSLLGTSPSSLSSVTFAVEQGNTAFKIKDGALMNAAETVVYAFNTASEISSFTSQTVTEVKPYAFAYAKKLKTVTLPRLATLGEYAFAGSGLTAVSLDIDVIGNAFIDCTSLKTVTLGEHCTTIGDYAFAYSGAKTVNMSAVASIGNYAFAGCVDYKTVILPEACTAIGNYSFDHAGVTAINLGKVLTVGNYAFQATPLTSVSLDSVKTVGSQAFFNCSLLDTVKIGVKCTSIGSQALRNISATAKITVQAFIPPVISSMMFGSPADAREMTFYIQSDVVETYKTANVWKDYAARIVADTNQVDGVIKKNDFYMFENGEFISFIGDKTAAIVIPRELKSGLENIQEIIGSTANAYANIQITVETGSTSFKIDKGLLTSYDGKIVYSVTSAAEATLDLTGVEEIKPYAFYQNTVVTSVNLPDVVTIRKNAFQNSAVSSITIGTKCKLIEETALRDKAKSMQITITALTPPTLANKNAIGLSATSFKGKILVPLSRLEVYKSAENWSTFATKMEAIPEETVTVGGGWTLTVSGAFVSYSGDKKNVVIPKELTYLYSLTSILGETQDALTGVTYSVEEGNTTFKIKNGMLMSADEKTVYAGMSTVSENLTLTGVVEVKPYAFAYLTGIKTVSLPDVVKVDKAAFYQCTGITSVDIGDKVTLLDALSFNGITSASVTIRAVAVPTTVDWEEYTFNPDTFTGKIYVPKQSVSAYINDMYGCFWNFETNIEAIPEA